MARFFLVSKIGTGTPRDPFRAKYAAVCPGIRSAIDYPGFGVMLLRVDETEIDGTEAAAYQVALEAMEPFLAEQPDVVAVSDDVVVDTAKLAKLLGDATLDTSWVSAKLTAAEVRGVLEAEAKARQATFGLAAYTQQVAVAEGVLADKQAVLDAVKQAAVDKP